MADLLLVVSGKGHALQVPGVLLSGLQAGDVLPLVGGGQLKLPHSCVHPLHQRRQGRNLLPLQGGLGLLEYPGVAETAPANHGHIRTGVAQDMGRRRTVEHVAVGDDRDGHCLLYLPDVVPVGGAGVHLGAGPAMDRHSGHPGGLHGLRKLHAVDGALVPAQAEFDGHRPLTGAPHHRLSHPDGLVHVPHQAGAVAGVGHLGHRAAHVDIDDIRAGHLSGDGCGLLHAFLVAAENLGGAGMFPLPQLEQRDGLLVLIAQGLGADHLGNGVPGAQLPADGTEGHIGHTCHGRKTQF